MKKIEVEINKYILSKIEKPIREKTDIIILLLETINLLLTVQSSQVDEDKNKIIVYIDKMSRVIYKLENKIFSINFPFTCEIKENNISIREGMQEIDAQVVSSLMEIILEMKDNNELDIILEKIIELDNIYKIINKLLTYEYGYIRYDYDQEHANGNIHPLNHLDINYMNTNQYKLGLKNRINTREFIDILNLNTECYFLNKNP